MKTTTKIEAESVTVGSFICKTGDQPREVYHIREERGKLRFSVRGTRNPEQAGCMTYGKKQLVRVCA